MSTTTEDFDTLEPGDEEVFAGLRRSVGPATLDTSAADVVALGRRTRNRHRALAAGIGTGAVAVVAAIGVLVPSAGTGAKTGTTYGTAPQAGPQAGPRTGVLPGGQLPGGSKSPAPTGGSQSGPQETGFTLDEQSDGTIGLTVKTITDPAALQAALDKAGVPAAVVVQQIPEGWDLTRGIQCAPQAGVHRAGAAGGDAITFPKGPSHVTLLIHPEAIPAGDYVTMTQFQSDGRQKGTDLGLYVGRMTTCVPEYVTRSSNGPKY